MTTSDYLKAQADLLIAAIDLHRLRLVEFIEMAHAAEGDGLRDPQGLVVVSDLVQMQEVAKAAQLFVALALPGRRGPGVAMAAAVGERLRRLG